MEKLKKNIEKSLHKYYYFIRIYDDKLLNNARGKCFLFYK